jgi:mono/diheme cytochrome c family protein
MRNESGPSNRRRLAPIILITAFLTLLTVLGAVLAFVVSGVYDVAAKNPHSPLFRRIVSMAMERSVRFHAEEKRAPDFSDSTLLRHGYRHYRTMCVTCHGEPGENPSEVGMGLNPKAPELSKTGGKWSDSEIHWIIRNGIRMTGMPAFGETHDEKEIWGLVAFIRAMSGLSPDEYGGLAWSLSDHSHDRQRVDSTGPEKRDQSPKGHLPFKRKSLF